MWAIVITFIVLAWMWIDKKAAEVPISRPSKYDEVVRGYKGRELTNKELEDMIRIDEYEELTEEQVYWMVKETEEDNPIH